MPATFELRPFMERELPRRLAAQPELENVAAVVAIELREAPPGLDAWSLTLSKGTGHTRRGAPTERDLTLRAHVLDWQDLAEGYASVRAALTDGRLEVEGDWALATRLAGRLFDARAG